MDTNNIIKNDMKAEKYKVGSRYMLPTNNQTEDIEIMINTDMKKLDKKEKVIDIVGKFLECNKGYAIEVYVESSITENIIVRMLVPCDRKEKSTDNEYLLNWKQGDMDFDSLEIPYDEVLDCYNTEDIYGKYVKVIMKNGIIITLECVGMTV